MTENLQKYLDKFKSNIESDELYTEEQIRSLIGKSQITEKSDKPGSDGKAITKFIDNIYHHIIL